MTKYISFSVYGSNQIYLQGALENSQKISEVYPEWKGIFYLDRLISPDIAHQLEDSGSQVVIRNLDLDPHGMFWRFDAAKLSDAETIIFRDADSRVSHREARAVSEWESSKFDIHVMRDHPLHCFWILGGMWGIRGNLLSELAKNLPRNLSQSPKWGLDQDWLAHKVYKPNFDKAFVHDSFFKREKSVHFPTSRVSQEFVGEPVDEFGQYSESLRSMVRRAEEQPQYLLKLRTRDWFKVRLEQSLRVDFKRFGQ